MGPLKKTIILQLLNFGAEHLIHLPLNATGFTSNEARFRVAAVNNETVRQGTHLLFETLLYLRQGHGGVLWATPETNTQN